MYSCQLIDDLTRAGYRVRVGGMITDTEAESMLWRESQLQDEIAALRATLRKVRNSAGWWAALSYVDGVRGQKSRWTEEEQELLRRAGL